MLDQFHRYFCLFHGSFTKLYTQKVEEGAEEEFRSIVYNFTHNFNKYFFAKEYSRNLMWNLCFNGFFYCPIDRKTFLQAQYLQNGIFMEFEEQVKHVALF